MERVNRLEVPVAKLQHQRWRMRLDRFLKGRENLTEAEAVSHRDCDLGKWMYTDGMAHYGTTSEMKNLEREHEKFHTMVRRIIQLKNSNDDAGAQAEYEKLELLSDEVIALLDSMDRLQ